MIYVFAMVYLANLLVFSKNEQDHAEYLHWVLCKLHEQKLKVKCKKSAYSLAELQYLSHIIKDLTIDMDQQKIEMITKWPAPTTGKELQTFLGQCNFYAKFVKDSAAVAAPLHNLLSK